MSEPQMDPAGGDKSWYIVHTYSGFEKKVAESLQQRVQAYGLQGEIGQFVTQQALSQAFQEVFYLIAVLFAAAILLMPFCRTVLFSDAPSAEAH